MDDGVNKAPKEQSAGYSAPPGTYPDMGKGAPPPAAKPEPRVWRTGTVTVALAMIAAGALLVAWVFVPNLDVIFLARLSPLLVVALGIELLAASARHKGQAVKYNGLTVFLSLVILAGSGAAAVLPQAVWRVYERRAAGDRVAAELEWRSGEQLERTEDGAESVEWYVNVRQATPRNGMAAADLAAEDYTQLRLVLGGNYKDAQGFAAGCRAALDAVQGEAPHVDYATIYGYESGARAPQRAEGDVRYCIVLDGRHTMGRTAEQMAGYVETQYWEPGAEDYVGEAQYRELREEVPVRYFVGGALAPQGGEPYLRVEQYTEKDGGFYALLSDEDYAQIYGAEPARVDGTYVYIDGEIHTMVPMNEYLAMRGVPVPAGDAP